MLMKKILLINLLTVCAIAFSHAQEFLPFVSSNYAGVTGIHFQPASIADSRYKVDLSLSSTSLSFRNNFLGIDPYVIWHPELTSSLGDWDSLQYIKKNYDGKDKNFQSAYQQDLLSFMISLSDKDAIGFTPSVRSVFNIDNVSEPLAYLMDKALDVDSLWYRQLSNANLAVQSNTWLQFGLTYARVILDQKKHFLKAGATAKLLQGLGSAYMFVKDLSYQFSTKDTALFFKSYFSYGASDNIYQLDEGSYTYKFMANPSLGFDIGIVYEFRPDWEKYKYDLDGKTNLWRNDKNKYLFKVGLSILDIGSVHYRRHELSSDFQANFENWYIGETSFDSYESFNDTLRKHFIFKDIPIKYKMNLPTAISVQTDVNIWKGVFLAVSPFIALNRGNQDVNKVHYFTNWNIIPRFESKWFGLSLPIQYNSMKQTNIGIGTRLGPFWIGSNDIISYLVSDNYRYGASFSMALKVPIMYSKPKDKDQDKVSDRRDECPTIPGPLELKGCPDTDGDGITDADDKCPTIPGVKELAGCPDSDGDGVTDELDQCPDVKGLPAFNGCPDSDGDGIIDSRDECPFNAGLASFNGCPDQDEDGIPDKDDNCPTLPGSRENKGCPFVDSDGDGVKDENDHCPGVKGPVENFGCPYSDADNDGIPDKDDECPSIAGVTAFRGCKDTDGDGISDKYDLCPTTPGIAENNGCPEIKKEEQEVINKAFDNLEFETGKSVIRTSSYISLDELAQMMIKRPEFRLLLSGHTDNVGKPETNMNLSKNRTMAVKDYLIKKGIDESKIKTEWFGHTKPIADNSTADGRQRNRRVEMKLYFD
jgi:outer membrane protein OmpA-like peptidoglycan-associated protein